MAIQGIAGAAPALTATAKASGVTFAQAVQGGRPMSAGRPVGLEGGPLRPKAVTGPSATQASMGPARAKGIAPASAGKSAVCPTADVRATHAARWVERLSAAQAQMDDILRMAKSGRNFSPAELLALQANVYQASQELDLAGKVVEKVTSGVKQVLQTQI